MTKNVKRRDFVIGLTAVVASLCPVTRGMAEDYTAAVYDAAARHGVDGDYLYSVMLCESGGDPNAYNPRTGDSGIMQFNPSTFYAWGGEDLWDPYEQIELAAWAFSQGLDHHWVCSGRFWV